ncbi:hypothetical protein J2T20_004127 [Paenibacillus wynnii]|nr:hypothetical protein [Paenibacillus wynnii]
MGYNIQRVHDFQTFLEYCVFNLSWEIDADYFEDIDDIVYDFCANDIGIRDEEFSTILSLKQLRPLIENQLWGIFSIEFDKKSLDITSLRKIFSRLIPGKRSKDYATWQKEHLLFVCFWGEEPNRTIGLVHFEESDSKIPVLKIFDCTPRMEERFQLEGFEAKLACLTWPIHNEEAGWFNVWKKAFTTRYRENIRDAKTLTLALAAKAVLIKGLLIRAFAVENSNGKTRALYESFRSSFNFDFSELEFADMYAQTIVYGLFSARCMSEKGEFNLNLALESLPNTNPFLKALLAECYSKTEGQLFDEFGIQDLVELLANTDTAKILMDFNRQTGGGKEDPVIYFYEAFLDAYESEQKKRKGVYYTPYPVVDFMVRSVNELLKSKFDVSEGVASGKISILDPATGTGTFLRRIILQAFDEFKNLKSGITSNQLKQEWNFFVQENLLKRLNGFELMMAPYAVAHMKLAMVLKDTGYDFLVPTRINVFLTDTLSGLASVIEKDLQSQSILSIEATEANKIKNCEKINLVIGNPPYYADSKNQGDWIMNLMEDYKLEPGTSTRLQERNFKVINDDYVKFIRFAQNMTKNQERAIIAFVTPHSYMGNLTFRGMRWRLLDEFDEVFIIDLHGNVMSRERFEGVERDENVFDIQQGISISIFVKSGEKAPGALAKVHYTEITSSRANKYSKLLKSSINNIDWTTVKPIAPNFFFKPVDLSNLEVYQNGISLSHLFPKYLGGVKTHNDEELVSFQPFQNEFNQFYDYRPFDIRHIYYDRRKVSRDRYEVMKHFIGKVNYGLIISRQVVADNWSHVQIVRNMADNRVHYSRKGIPVECPMYLYNTDGSKTANVDAQALMQINEITSLVFDMENGISDNLGSYNMLDLFDFTYAILNSPGYRTKYKELLSIDFPRIPLPHSKEMFVTVIKYGTKLRKLHLLDIDIHESYVPQFCGYGNNVVIKSAKYQNGRIYINNTQFFNFVSEIAWNFCLGGYAPAQKWLKDRKGYELSQDDISHYIKMVGVFNISNELMQLIDVDLLKFGII